MPSPIWRPVGGALMIFFKIINFDRVAKRQLAAFLLHGKRKVSFSLSSQIDDNICRSPIWHPVWGALMIF
jgi:hypothetical protein